MRQCDECDVCCIIPSIEDLKPANYVCPNLDQTTSCNKCKIYNMRPQVCKEFECSWKLGHGDEQSRPNQNNILTTIKEFNNGVWIIAIELAPRAAVTTGKNIIVDLVKSYDLPVIIQSYNGIETGDRTVIKNSLLNRTVAMTGNLIEWLDHDAGIGLYELVNPKA